MATVNAERFGIDGQTYTLIDGTARENAQLALNNAEYNRQSLIGKYGGPCTSASPPATSLGCASATTSTCRS